MSYTAMRIYLLLIVSVLSGCFNRDEVQKQAENYDSPEQYHDAIKLWSAIIERYPNDVYAITSRGNDYLGIEEFEKAKKDLLLGSKLYYYNIVALSNLAYIYYHEDKKYDSALFYVNKAIKNKPTLYLKYKSIFSEEARKSKKVEYSMKHQYNVEYAFLMAQRGLIYEKLNIYDSAYKDLSYAFRSGYLWDSVPEKTNILKLKLKEDTLKVE